MGVDVPMPIIDDGWITAQVRDSEGQHKQLCAETLSADQKRTDQHILRSTTF